MIDSFEKIIDPNFINAELIGGPGASRVVTITDIDYREAWNSKRNAKEMRQCLVFSETKPLILNKTNARKLKEIFSPNEDKPENCIGKQIELYVIETTVGRAKTTGIRIREHATEKCEECSQPITTLQGKTVDWTIQYSLKHTGKKLCPNCMRNWANKNTNQEEKA